MYFESRADAGRQLAARLFDKYRYENCAVIALSNGGVLVGEEIASALHCTLTMLLIEEIDVPGEGVSFGGMSEKGNFTFNGMFSAGDIEDYTSEYHGYLDEKKREAFQRMNRLLGDGGLIDRSLLRDHTIILVSDGIFNGAAIDVAMEFLKPVRSERIVIATPFASILGVDKMHMTADEVQILDVKENYIETNHYYEDNTIPSKEETIAKINQVILNWS
jgi:putative phosphoribosyl transferase